MFFGFKMKNILHSLKYLSLHAACYDAHPFLPHVEMFIIFSQGHANPTIHLIIQNSLPYDSIKTHREVSSNKPREVRQRS